MRGRIWVWLDVDSSHRKELAAVAEKQETDGCNGLRVPELDERSAAC
jgi:hypothetical protein